MQQGKQTLRARLQLLARLALNAGKHTANQPARLAHLDDGNDRAILVQGNEGPAQIVRLGHRATPSIDVSDEIAILAARPIASLRGREMDSNFQYAGAVNLVVGPFGWVVLCDRVRSGRGASGTAVSATGLGDLSRRLGASHRPSDLWCARLGSNRAHGSIHDAADRERRYHTCRRRNRRRNPARRRKIFDRTSGAATPSRPRATWHIRRRL